MTVGLCHCLCANLGRYGPDVKYHSEGRPIRQSLAPRSPCSSRATSDLILGAYGMAAYSIDRTGPGGAPASRQIVSDSAGKFSTGIEKVMQTLDRLSKDRQPALLGQRLWSGISTFVLCAVQPAMIAIFDRDSVATHHSQPLLPSRCWSRTKSPSVAIFVHNPTDVSKCLPCCLRNRKRRPSLLCKCVSEMSNSLGNRLGSM